MSLLDSNAHTTLRWLRRATSHLMGAMMLLLTQLARGVGAFFNIDIQPVKADLHSEHLVTQNAASKEHPSISKVQSSRFSSYENRLDALKKDPSSFSPDQLSVLKAAHENNLSQRRFAVVANPRLNASQMSVLCNAFDHYPRLSAKQADMWVANPHFSPHKMAALACALGIGLDNVRELSDIGDPHIFESLNSMLVHQNHAPLERAEFESLSRTLGSDITPAFTSRDVISLSVNSEEFDLLSARLKEASIPFEATKDYETREISGTLSPISLFSVSPENDTQREAFAEIQSQMLNNFIETSREDVSRSPESDAAILEMETLACPDKEIDAPEQTSLRNDQPDLDDPGDLER